MHKSSGQEVGASTQGADGSARGNIILPAASSSPSGPRCAPSSAAPSPPAPPSPTERSVRGTERELFSSEEGSTRGAGASV